MKTCFCWTVLRTYCGERLICILEGESVELILLTIASENGAVRPG